MKATEVTPDLMGQVVQFLKEQCPDHPELADSNRFKWQRSKHWVALDDDGRIRGYIGQICETFCIGSIRKECGFAIDVIPDTLSGDAIRKESGRLLLKTAEDNLPYTGVGIVPGIIPVYERRGHIVRREDARMYIRPIRPKAVIDYIRSKATWGHVNAKKIMIPFLTVANWIYPREPFREPEVVAGDSAGRGGMRRIERFDPKDDPTWLKWLSNRYGMFAKRDADYLNYKLEQPYRKYNVFIHENERHEADGYIVWRQAVHPTTGFTIIKIGDLVGSDAARNAAVATVPMEGDAVMALGSALDRDFYRRAGLWLSIPYTVVIPPGHEEKVHVSFFDSDLDDMW
jgi:hypothetical protein